jgi:glycosyltransferase involved in cell wall biosynthesis
LKIYEAMAARVPVVSTTIGAEGLDIHPPSDIRIADSPEDFAAQCVELLAGATERERIAARAYELVATRFSWEHVIDDFERLLAS